MRAATGSPSLLLGRRGRGATSRVDSAGKMPDSPGSMIFTEIIEEIPSLTRTQRREVALRLFEMESTEAEAGDLATCEHSAALGFALLEAMEAEDTAP